MLRHNLLGLLLRPRLKNRQPRPRAANVFPPGRKASLEVFFELLGRLEEQVVRPVLFVLAIDGRMIAANLRPRFIDAAAVIGQELAAFVMNLDVPLLLFDEDAGAFVQQKPAQNIKILAPRRRIELQRKIAAAFGNAMVAQRLARAQIFAPRLPTRLTRAQFSSHGRLLLAMANARPHATLFPAQLASPPTRLLNSHVSRPSLCDLNALWDNYLCDASVTVSRGFGQGPLTPALDFSTRNPIWPEASVVPYHATLPLLADLASPKALPSQFAFLQRRDIACRSSYSGTPCLATVG